MAEWQELQTDKVEWYQELWRFLRRRKVGDCILLAVRKSAENEGVSHALPNKKMQHKGI